MSADAKTARAEFLEFASVFTEELMMIVRFYVDESGTDGRSKVIAVGGYISRRQEWCKFCGRWSEVLAQYKVPFLHTVEFMNEELIDLNPSSPYRGWDA